MELGNLLIVRILLLYSSIHQWLVLSYLEKDINETFVFNMKF